MPDLPPRPCPALSPRDSSLAQAPGAGSARPVKGRHSRPAQGCGPRAGTPAGPEVPGGARRNPEQGCCGTWAGHHRVLQEDQPPPRAWVSPGLPFAPSRPRQTIPSSEAISVQAFLQPVG